MPVILQECGAHVPDGGRLVAAGGRTDRRGAETGLHNQPVWPLCTGEAPSVNSLTRHDAPMQPCRVTCRCFIGASCRPLGSAYTPLARHDAWMQHWQVTRRARV